ncbi:sigma-70 family RNA polymerase sigma factor [Paenibacillus antri]|uniref:Sigma-70 family RNA polymerase sigma factor n=1 Tax=Paenibacillus antri TaxID=2582848 RepID=A0A5R9FWV9_9BACL|nr:sigma-70 family RNA polymerase sigma factor [Paenibacillus antri]TLS48477.1 sigma-70 family RNA polymerase sigma factor [Paenibacillus antri]
MLHLSDGELMRLVKAKRRAALSELYDRYASLVYSFALKAMREESAAREVVQTVFLRLWTTESEYDPEKGAFSSWLVTITRNIAIDRKRRIRREAERQAELAPERWERIPDETNVSPEELAIQSGMRQQIRTAYRHLSAQQIALLEHFYWNGYSLSELSKLYGQPLGTVKHRLHQTLKILRRHLTAEGEGW